MKLFLENRRLFFPDTVYVKRHGTHTIKMCISFMSPPIKCFYSLTLRALQIIMILILILILIVVFTAEQIALKFEKYV